MAAAVTEQQLAQELYRRVLGEEPQPPHSWQLQARPHPGDPRTPLFEVGPDNWHVHLNLHPGQLEAWQSDKRMTFMLAGTQGGKTTFLPWLLARDILASTTGGDWLAVTVTYDMFKLKMLPAMLEVFEHVLQIGRYWARDKVIEICDPLSGAWHAQRASDPMWGRIILRSASSRGGLESATAQAVILDECGQDAFDWQAWLAIRRRLTLARGRVWAATTLFNLGWLKQKIHDPWERRQHPDVHVVQFPSTLNPAFSEEEFEDARSSMQDYQFRMLYEGKFGRPAAAIFRDFIDAPRHEGGHKVARFPLPREWPRFQGVDAGIINTTRLWAARDPEADIWYVYRCLLGSRKPATEHAQSDLELEDREGERVVLRAIGSKSEKYWREDYRRAGAEGVREPDTHDVEEGIDRIVRLLKQHRIFFFDDLHELLGGIMEYARELDKFGEPTARIREKSRFHSVDALRYLCIQLVRPRSEARIRTEVSHYA